MSKSQRYRVKQWDDSKAKIEVYDKNTGFSREFSFKDFYCYVSGGGCEYAAKLPDYVVKQAYALIDASSNRFSKLMFERTPSPKGEK